MSVADSDLALQTLSSECVVISSVLTVFSCQDKLLHNVDWLRVETRVATNRTQITVFVFVCFSFILCSYFPLFFFDISSFLNVSFLLILSLFLSSFISSFLLFFLLLSFLFKRLCPFFILSFCCFLRFFSISRHFRNLCFRFYGMQGFVVRILVRTFLHFQGSVYYLPLKHREPLT